MKSNLGKIEFAPNGRGTWIGRTWNGVEWIKWKGVFMDKQEAIAFAKKQGREHLFIVC